jgi:hypothetical protein
MHTLEMFPTLYQKTPLATMQTGTMQSGGR